MNFFQKHSFVHYFFHTALAVFLLLVLVFSENIFPNSLSYASNLVFGEKTLSREGEVYKHTSFETKEVDLNGGFFEGESFLTKKNSSLSLSFSDFTVLRAGEDTTFSVGHSIEPEVRLEKGKVWVATKEYVVTYLPQAKVETLAGSTLIKRSEQGKMVVVAWDKPSRVTFLSKENTELWSFLLPSQHQVEFSPQEFFSFEDFSQLRFSKLKKEFPIKKISASSFITENIGKDRNWNKSILKNIEERTSDFFGTEMKSSLFSLSPNTQNKKQETSDRADVITIWDALHKKNFTLLEVHMKDLSPERKKNFYKYAGFFPHREKSTNIFVKSFPTHSGKLWKELWMLESIVSGGLDTKFEQDRLRKSIMAEAIESQYDPEEIQFFAVSLFKNYADDISYAIIDFFYDANENLIASETSEQDVLTRKLEIINDVFSFTEDLIERKEYLLARKVLDKVEGYISSDTSPLLAAKKKKILAQKDYIRGEVEYAEILGDEDREHFESYLSIKKNAEDQLEEQNLHAAPSEEEFPLENAQNLFEENNISFDSLTQDATQNNLFSFVQEKNGRGILFSGTFDLKNKRFSRVIVYEEISGTIKERKDIYSYTFSFSEISDIDDDILETLFSQQKSIPEKVVDTEAIPSEIADLVHTLAQDAFVSNDVMVHSYNLHVVEINTAKVVGAIAHYSEIARQEDIDRRKKVFKGSDNALNTEFIQIEKYTFDCLYNVETNQVFNVTAYAYDKKILLPGTMTLEKMLSLLDEKSKNAREKIEIKDQSVLHLKSIGVAVDSGDIQWKDVNTLHMNNMSERSTGVVFNGVYKPFSQKFTEITFLNISSNPVVLKKSISLDALEEDFLSQKNVLIEKVQNQKK